MRRLNFSLKHLMSFSHLVLSTSQVAKAYSPIKKLSLLKVTLTFEEPCFTKKRVFILPSSYIATLNLGLSGIRETTSIFFEIIGCMGF